MAVSPIQTAFTGGEISERVQARFDAEVRQRSLSFAENFMCMPQGSLLMRAGSVHIGTEGSAPRLIPFRLLGAEEDIILALTAGHVKGYLRSGPLRALGPNLAFAAGWTTVTTGGAIDRAAGLECFVTNGVAPNRGKGRLALVTIPGDPYRIKFSGFFVAAAGPVSAIVRVGTSIGGAELWSKTFSSPSGAFSEDLTVTVPGAALYVELEILSGFAASDRLTLSPLTVQDAGALVDLVSPWTAEQIRDLQFVSEPAKNKMYLVHPNVAPQVITYTPPGTWALAPAAFVAPPAAWVGTNWPGAVELHQGRLLLGATPAEPNTWWGSKSGALLDFTPGVNPGDPYSYIVSTKGRIRWMQGQKALLLGSDVIEHSAVGSSAGAIITPSSVDIRDESAFGSAAIQAVHLGDQVVFVTRDRRRVRALNYSNDDNAWISRALTFAAEHLTEGKIREVHYARSPFSMLLVVLDTGEVRACTYERGEQVLAWWRVNLGVVESAAIADGPAGSYLWVAAERAAGHCIEFLPLHEMGAVFVDSSASGIVAVDGTFAGLAHLEGETVRVIVRGALEADQVVAGGQVTVDVALAGEEIIVGRAYGAKAVTLPREVKTGKARDVKVGALLSDSALPLLNGKRAADRTPSTAQDAPEALRSGRCQLAHLGWSDDGAVTIEQDLPFRTEVLAVFAVTAAERI